MNKRYILGIDTSNYKTSIAVVDNDGTIVCDLRRFLSVKQGEKGLRQSDALFQHVKNMPELMKELRKLFDGKFDAISYSSKPRPLEGSYMPVFLAGESFAHSLGEALAIPVFSFSHQEGHIEAIKTFSKFNDEKRVMACHFSGGTSELLDTEVADNGYKIKIIGGSKDISFGQVLDRAGVMLNMNFPAGEELDSIALKSTSYANKLTPIKVKEAWLNLSGIDTQMKKLLETIEAGDIPEDIIGELFDKISSAMSKMIIQGSEMTGINKVIMAGGVSSSIYIKSALENFLENAGIEICFDSKGLSQDNAVGTALLGGKAIWR